MDLSFDKNGRRVDCWYHEVCQADVRCNACARFEEMSYLMENSNLPKSKQKPIALDAPQCDVTAYKRLNDIKSNIVDFVQSGSNLYITSHNTGNGKTSWAIKLMLKYFDEVWAGNGFNVRAIFIHVPAFLMKCKDFKTVDSDFEKLRKQLFDVDLVVWDDIASTNLSGYDYSQLLIYIDNRLLSDKANIYTGNCDSREMLDERLGNKLSSRIWSSQTEIITFKGGDQR